MKRRIARSLATMTIAIDAGQQVEQIAVDPDELVVAGRSSSLPC